MEATRRSARRIKTSKVQPVTHSSTQIAANRPGRATRSAAHQKMSAETGIAHQNSKPTPEPSQKNQFNPSEVPPINYATLLDAETQSSHATSPPPSEKLENNGREESGKEKGDLGASIAANLEMARQLEIEMDGLLGDNGSKSEEEASKSSNSTYNEVEDSVVVIEEPLKETVVAQKSVRATKPAKQSCGVRRAAKIITPRDIADDMGG